MTQVAEYRMLAPRWSPPAGRPYPGDLPRTDDLLARSVAISVGIVDPGLGAGFGISVYSDEHEMADVASRFGAASRTRVRP